VRAAVMSCPLCNRLLNNAFRLDHAAGRETAAFTVGMHLHSRERVIVLA
jgi:hypothetical protein